MTTTRPTVRKGPAQNYASPGQTIMEFSDGESGGLISLARNAAGQLVVDIYRTDPDVIVRADPAITNQPATDTGGTSR